MQESRAELEQQLDAATSTVAILQTEKSKLLSELQESKKEQDDLLMLLADQDQKIQNLKQKLKDHGETVEKVSIQNVQPLLKLWLQFYVDISFFVPRPQFQK